MIIENINIGKIGYNINHDIHINEYYMYIVNLFKGWLHSQDKALNLVIGNYNFNFGNNNKIIKIDVQCEHTLVKDGGRSIGERIYGQVKHKDGNYLVRIDKYDYLNSLDIVIEYSLPNMFNILSNKKFNDYYTKNIYIAPILYDINFSNLNKTDIVTLFSKNGSQRRGNILADMVKLNIPNKTIESCFSSQCILDLYDSCRILVNVHQTDHHHTFEELRVLPALLNGVIIISEDVPLKETIKYSDYIIWVNYDEIANKTLEVMNNYDYYYNKIFGDGVLSLILTNLKDNNIKTINNIKI